MTIQKTEKVSLDIENISEELYALLVKEFQTTRDNVVYVNNININAVLEFKE